MGSWEEDAVRARKPSERRRDGDVLWSLRRVAEFLEKHVQTLYRWKREGKLPACHWIGHRIFWWRSDILRWVSARRDD
jgi:predicted DNA-binding transcriptional regulator AlpA